MSSELEINETMGDWLGTLVTWDVFSTWTFARPVQVHGAYYWTRRHLQRLEKIAGLPLYAFFGLERGNRGGLLHVHALVGNVGHLLTYCGERLPPGAWGKECCMVHAWPCGIARVVSYDPALGARHYVSKYVTKSLAEWELWGFPATHQTRLSLRP